MKYIDAEKLFAEIERREKIIRNSANQISDSEKKTYYSGCADALLELLPFITSLQQEHPEVDIEKEITEHAENMPHGEFTHDSECAEHEEWAKREFYHFYELGLNARKED